MTKEFVADECARLDAALRGGGRIRTWSVDTAPLRLAMNGAYEVYAAEAEAAIGAVLARLADDLGEVRRDLLGGDAAAPAPPRAPVVPAPIPFARTMTIDSDIGWWRRLLGAGVRERVEELRAAIRLESLALINEFGTKQVPHLLRETRRTAEGFLADHSGALVDVVRPRDGRARGAAEQERLARLAAAEARLAALAARLSAEGAGA